MSKFNFFVKRNVYKSSKLRKTPNFPKNSVRTTVVKLFTDLTRKFYCLIAMFTIYNLLLIRGFTKNYLNNCANEPSYMDKTCCKL